MMTFSHSLSASYIRAIRDSKVDDAGRITVKRKEPKNVVFMGARGKRNISALSIYQYNITLCIQCITSGDILCS
jgi:hypothetical protein